MGAVLKRLLLFTVLSCLHSMPSQAQTVGPLTTGVPAGLPYSADEPKGALKEGRVLHAFRLTANPPDVDGRLNDDVWRLAASSGGYSQRDPDNGRLMTEATHVQVAYDDRALYVAVTCDDSDPRGIAGGLGRRDDFPSTDYVGIGFDPRHDHLTAYQFETNPSAVQRDFTISDDDRFDFDYNAVWEVRTEVTERGWTAEFRIPFSQMRFGASPDPGQVWGLNQRRWIRRKAELGTWVPKPRGERGEVSLFGHLVFDAPIAPPRRLELVPYVLTRAERTPTPAGSLAEFAGSAGADARVGLGPAMTLSAAINPDFGQVEQDPSVLNLSVFETFYPEKRPFFLEDSRTFVPPYGLFQLFHSRRIGRKPERFAIPAGDTVTDRPDDTTILGAAKLTGKTSGWTFGGLSALTGREYAHLDATRASAARRHLVEPLTSYNVVRLQRDVLRGTSNIGVIGTGVVREGSDNAFTGGGDYNLRWAQNRAYANGHWVATQAPGSGGVRTSGGGVNNVGINQKYWSVWSHQDHFGRDFRVNDLGFFRGRTNRNQVDGGFSLEQPDPRWGVRNGGFNVYGGEAWTDERLVFNQWVGGNQWMTFRNFWGISTGFSHNFEALNDLDTRGGPPILSPSATFGYVDVNSDSRKSWRVGFHADGRRDAVGGSNRAVRVNLTLQPSGRLQVSTAARYEFGTDVAQWIKNVDTTGDDGVDHVYGTLRRHVIDLTLRGTYAINRDLTLQAYLQPFVAVGDYDHIRRLARPRSFEFAPAELDTDPDFNRKSVSGNMVLRWEYVRGSTFFVVWNLNTLDDTSDVGRFNPARDLRNAFGADATNVVMIKVSYWLNR